MPSIPLTARDGSVRGYAQVSEVDAHLFRYDWRLHGGGYACRAAGRVLLHREIMGCFPGDGVEIDHEDGNRLNCCRENLAFIDRVGNSRNRSITGNANNTSGYRGVYLDKRDDRWYGQVKIDGRSHTVGRFANAEDAHEATEAYRQGIGIPSYA